MSERIALAAAALVLASVSSAHAGPLFRAPSLIFDTGPTPTALAIADLDRDGRPDLVVTNAAVYTTGVPSVSVMFGNGDGTFRARRDIVTGGLPHGVAVGDLNGDGWPDLAMANYGTNALSVFLGTGSGTFAPSKDFDAGPGPRTVAIADINADGHPDLVTERSVLLGNGDGTFGARIGFPGGSCVAIGDLNGDGRLDLATNAGTDPNPDDYIGVGTVLLGNGDGTFTVGSSFETGFDPCWMAVADFNGDGKLDLAVANYGHTPDYYGTVSALLGNGDGTFGGQLLYDTGANPNSVAVADLDGDGHPDIVTSNFGDDPDFDSNTVSIFLGYGNGDFHGMGQLNVGENPSCVSIADLNGDGHPDLATASLTSNTISELLGNGNGTFGTSDVPTGHGPTVVAIADLNGDGRPDVIAGDNGFLPAFHGTVSVHLGNGDGSLMMPMHFQTGGSPYGLTIADLNGDGRPDVVTANAIQSSVSVLLGNGNGVLFEPRNDIFTGGSPYSVAVSDLNGDGRSDLAVAKTASNTVAVLLGNGDGTFAGQSEFATGGAPTFVGIRDFNADGWPDLLTMNQASNSISVLLGNGDGTFRTRTNFGIRGSPKSIAIGDLDGDGRLDLAVTKFNGDSAAMLLGKPDGTFGAESDTYVAAYTGNFLAIADFNQDGHADIAALASDLIGFVTILLGNGDGTFAAGPRFGVGGQPDAIAAGDLNGDGSPDLVVANSYPGSISVLLASGDIATPVQMSLVSADAGPGRVALRWWGEGAASLGASVYRRTANTDWQHLGDAIVEGADLLRYEDRAVAAGARYAYRLGYLDGAAESFTDETWVDVPVAFRLALDGFRPNPAFGAAIVSFTLVDGSPAALEVLDVAGRRVLKRDVGGLGAGRHVLALDAGARLAPGTYLIRLRQSDRVRTARGVVVR